MEANYHYLLRHGVVYQLTFPQSLHIRPSMAIYTKWQSSIPKQSMSGIIIFKTKDQCFECIQEWLEGEVQTMRGRTKGDFEITLFSDLGEAESKKVHQLCNKYGVVQQSTAGYTPEHNAFVERWFRTNAEMSRCQMLQYDSPDATV